MSSSSSERWAQWLSERRRQLGDEPATPVVEGKLKRVVGLMLEAVGCQVPIGGYCMVQTADHDWLETEVVGFSGDRILLMPTGDMRGVMPDARVIPQTRSANVPVGNGLLGRVIDAAGNPLDGKGSLNCNSTRSLQSAPINPLLRKPIREPLVPWSLPHQPTIRH